MARFNPGLGYPVWRRKPPANSSRRVPLAGVRFLLLIGLVTKAPKRETSMGALASKAKPKLPAAFIMGVVRARSNLGIYSGDLLFEISICDPGQQYVSGQDFQLVLRWRVNRLKAFGFHHHSRSFRLNTGPSLQTSFQVLRTFRAQTPQSARVPQGIGAKMRACPWQVT